MSIQGTIKRYSLIVNFIKANKRPSLVVILEMLHGEGFEISVRTLQRDIEAIRNDYGIELLYDISAKGYFFDYENSVNIEYILHFLELANSAQMLIETIKESKDVLKYISFDSADNYTGAHLLQPLITAIKLNQVVTFDYFNFQTEKTSSNSVRPYLLKEYQNRWFLYGENERYSEFRIYGLERMSNLVLNNSVFEPKMNFEPTFQFENLIGITLRPFRDGQTVQDVILSMSKEQGLYFKTLPWHPNYKVLLDDESEFQVSLRILPNYEFLQLLLRYCDKVTVLKPQWLRDRLKEILSGSASKY